MNESIHTNQTNKNNKNNIIQLKKTHDPIITVNYVSRFQKKIYVFNNVGNYEESIRRLLKKIENNQLLSNNEFDDLYQHFTREQIQKWIQYSKKYVLSFVNEYIYQDDQIHIIRKKLMIHLSNPNQNKYLLENNQQIWINSEQYFDQVSPQIWNFYIGGYQVCQKWLKDRKGRELNFDDINHYQNIISIISETIKIMEDIDIIIEKYGSFPLE